MGKDTFIFTVTLHSTVSLYILSWSLKAVLLMLGTSVVDVSRMGTIRGTAP